MGFCSYLVFADYVSERKVIKQLLECSNKNNTFIICWELAAE